MADLGSLAVSLAGAAIGSAFGSASLGYLAGSILGSLLFPTEQPDINNVGPRATDLKVTASTYGLAIPKVFGMSRLGGNCIWATDIEERKNVSSQSSGGKGGSSQTSTTTTYSYFGTFALGFCEGVAEDVIRIWADSKLIYDKSASGALTRKSGLRFRFYPGSETQLPDSIIEADMGEGNVPGYRGLCYLVFDALALADYGNRLPNITAEIAIQSTPTFPFERFNIPDYIDYYGRIKNLGASNGTIHEINPYDSVRKLVYLPFISETSADLGYDQTYLACINALNGNILTIRSNDDMWADINESRVTDSTSNQLVPIAVDYYSNSVICTTADDNHKALLRVDGTSLRVTHELGAGLSASLPIPDLTGFPKLQSSALIEFPGNPAASMLFCLCVEGLPPVFNGTGLGIIRPRDLEVVYHSVTIGSTNYGRMIVPCTATALQAYLLFLSERDSTLSVWYMNLNHDAYYDVTDGVTYGVSGALLTEITPTEMNAAPGIQHTITGLFINSNGRGGTFAYDPDSDAIIGSREWTTASGTVYYAMSIDIHTGALNWVTHLPVSGGVYGEHGWLGDLSKTQTVKLGVAPDLWYELDKATGELLDTFDPVDWLGSQSGNNLNIAIDYDLNAMIRADLSVNQGPDPTSIGGIMFFDRGTGNGTTLASILTSLCADVGLESTDIDVTDLTGIDVRGYVVNSTMTARAAMTPLTKAYFFDAVESDYQLKFIERGGASVKTVPQQDLGAVQDNEYWVPERADEQELPMRITVGYIDIDRDYQEGAQHWQRAQNPFPVMYSKNEVDVGLPIVMQGTDAIQIAEKLLYNAWMDRTRYETVLPPKYLALDPADVITVNMDDGTSYDVRLASMEIGADFSIRISALAEDTANYTSIAEAENNFVSPLIRDASARSYFVIHNVPLLADTHDQARVKSILYAQAGALVPGTTWSGTSIYKSTDNVSWELLSRITGELTYGTASNALAAPSNVFAVDLTSTLTVWPVIGEDDLVSITYTQLLAGELNMAIIGGEIINFQNVTDNGDGSYTLDTFLRGRRGTDTAAFDHVSGEYFYLINDDNAIAFTIPLSQIDSPMYFKAVGSGVSLEETPTTPFTPTGEDLKPYAPVNAIRTDDSPSAGDITISWDRRTRINGAASGDVPLNEDAEEYEVDILDGTGGTVLRTLEATSESVEYDTADIITDFGSVPTTLYCRIYQMSAQVGRGKSYEFALEA